MCLEPCARVERDDGGWCLLRAQAVVIACVSYSASNKLVVLHEAVRQACNASDEELTSRVSLAGVEEVEASVRAHGPVVVLAGAVDACKGLLMEEHNQAQLLGLLSSHLHEQHIVVGRERGLAVDGRHLMLRRGHLVVDHRHGHTELQHLGLNLEEQLRNGVRHGGKVVQVSLLAARGQSAHERAAAVDQVRAVAVVLGLDDEELLLPTKEAVNCLRVSGNVDRLEQAQTLLVHGVIGAQEGGLVIEARPKVRDKTAGDPQDLVQHEARRRAVPSCEGCRCVCRSEPAVGERGAVSLAEEESLVGKRRLERLGALSRGPVQVNECVHLVGTDSASWGAATSSGGEEPVREGHGTQLPRPREDDFCNDLHVLLTCSSAGDERFLESRVHTSREVGLHGCVIEDQARRRGQLVIWQG
mmetsp:Transcript_97247/g.225448  ORF Transcript_97247/g.225448 Transcript_97247/m.225448 type:complete len:415 (+) Transcript_97247:1065-2309(+)